MKKLFSVSPWGKAIVSILGCAAISFPLLLTACSNSSSEVSDIISSYKAEVDLPDTDSTTVKTDKDSSSSSKNIESSADEGNKASKSSASEKSSDSCSSSGEVSSSGIGEVASSSSVEFSSSSEEDVILEKCGESGYDPNIQYCKGSKTPTDKPKCGDAEDALMYNPETQYCRSGTIPTSMSKCGEYDHSPLYNPEKWYCYDGEIVTLVEAVALAAKANEEKLLKQLVDQGVSFDVRGADGFYPIHWTVKNGNSEAMKYLIDKGADVNAKSSNGWSVLDWATEGARTDMIKVLKKAGAKNTPEYFIYRKEKKT